MMSAVTDFGTSATAPVLTATTPNPTRMLIANARVSWAAKARSRSASAGESFSLIVEIKSSVADFRADTKWREYRAHCDRFYFAIPEGVPVDIMPEDAGLILADAYGCDILTSHGRGHPPCGAHAFCAGGGAPAASLERPRGDRGGRLEHTPLFAEARRLFFMPEV
jgi:DNA repair protein MmcB-like